MEKKFDVIPVEDYYVVVDKDATKAVKGQWVVETHWLKYYMSSLYDHKGKMDEEGNIEKVASKVEVTGIESFNNYNLGKK